ncbi:transposase domain-containing protein [Streptomyces violascens]|uniref:transposase domain-containing protein n=1 Tax=Streptomyces violascens TaxID=67381 RepID=UPI003655DA0B
MTPEAESVPKSVGLKPPTWVYPPGSVDRVAACGWTEQRRRLLSASLMVYFVMGLAHFSPTPRRECYGASSRTCGILGGGAGVGYPPCLPCSGLWSVWSPDP